MTYYTPQELAGALKLSTDLIYKLIHNGQLEAEKWGRELRITDKAFEKYRENHKARICLPVQSQRRRCSGIVLERIK